MYTLTFDSIFGCLCRCQSQPLGTLLKVHLYKCIGVNMCMIIIVQVCLAYTRIDGYDNICEGSLLLGIYTYVEWVHVYIHLYNKYYTIYNIYHTYYYAVILPA